MSKQHTAGLAQYETWAHSTLAGVPSWSGWQVVDVRLRMRGQQCKALSAFCCRAQKRGVVWRPAAEQLDSS
uniref:Uncharacterized protein n=1 Tax=Oryza meridionalis TaxID=40149 RepID=A0A0E0DZU1_9ORYZ